MENVNPILREGNICWTGYGDQLRIMVPTERRHAMEAFSKTSEMALWRNTYVTQPQCKSIKIFWTPGWQGFKVEEVQDGNGVKVGQLVKKIADLKLYWGKDEYLECSRASWEGAAEGDLLLYRVFTIYNKLTFLMIGLYGESLEVITGKPLCPPAPPTFAM